MEVGSVDKLAACSVRWVVQKIDDIGVWRDMPELSSDCFEVAERNMRYVCNSLYAELRRHRVLRRVLFDFVEVAYAEK